MNVGFKFNDPQAPKPVRIEQVYAEKPGGGRVANPSFDVPQTTAVGLDGEIYKPIKAYRLYDKALADDTTIKVRKGSGVAVGDIIATGKKGVACTAVDNSNPDYDLVTVTLGVALAEDTVLYQAASASTNAAAPIYAPEYVIGNDLQAGEGDQLVRLINGANLRKATANISPEVAALIPTIKLV